MAADGIRRRVLVIEDNADTTRLVAVSGYASSEDRQRTRDAGFDEHVLKPSDADVLLRAVAGRG